MRKKKNTRTDNVSMRQLVCGNWQESHLKDITKMTKYDFITLKHK